MVVDVNRVGPEGIWGEVIQERRQHIADMARCVDCGITRKSNEAIARLTDDGVPDFCSRRPYPQACRYAEDKRMVDELMREVMAGEVRTVAEAYPPPVQGPLLPSYAWLLDQREWWYPHRRPAVRIAEMDKPWRWNTARYLEKRATGLHLSVGSRYMHDAPDDVWASWESEDPAEWLREQPLMKALGKGLPPVASRAGRLMAARAVHWHTCPMRRKHPAPADTCACVRDGFKVVGATNDPASLREPE